MLANTTQPPPSSSSTMTNKQQMLMQSITHFFESNRNLFMEFYEIVKPNSKVSLRVIDWFITNYSRVNDVNYVHPTKPNLNFSVHDSYKSQLKAYSKRQFDPFCRRMRINFHFSPTEKVVTTVGQLNFFRWAIENGVMSYINDHFPTIEQHMKTYVRDNRETKRQQQLYPLSSQEANAAVGGFSADLISKQNGDDDKNKTGGYALSANHGKHVAGGGAKNVMVHNTKSRRRNAVKSGKPPPPLLLQKPKKCLSPPPAAVYHLKTANNVVKQRLNHTVYFH
jgi:hypothetical protein